MIFAGKVPEADFEIVVNVESWAQGDRVRARTLRVDASASEGRMNEWRIENGSAERVLASSAQPASM